MPIYEFKCSNCNKKTEEIVSISERDTKEIFCPNCSNLTKRQISSPAPPIFKGQYSNMYSMEDVKNATASDYAEMTKDS